MNEGHETRQDSFTEADVEAARATKARQAECPHHRYRLQCSECGASLPRAEPGKGAYQMAIANVARYIRSHKNTSGDTPTFLDGYTASTVLSVAFCKAKEEVLADIMRSK